MLELATITVTTFRDVFSCAPVDAPLGSVLREIQAGLWRVKVEGLRTLLATDADAYKRAKRFLPVFLVSGTAASRTEPLVHSGLLQVDLDNLGEKLDAVREQVRRDPHIAFGFVSPSGHGLKLGVVIDGARHAESFAAAEAHFRQKYELAIDPSVRDRLRLCLVSWDLGLWMNADAVALPVPEAKTVAETPTPPLACHQAESAGDRTATATAESTLEEALRELPSEDYETWIQVGMALKDWDAERGLALWERWSQSSTKKQAGDCRSKWATFNSTGYEGRPVTVATIFWLTSKQRAKAGKAPDQPITATPISEFTIATGEDDQELIRRRFLCRGAGALLVGQAGIGKSSLIVQMALSWGIGRDLFGFSPTRPLTSLIVQAENDAGDLAEIRDGVIKGLRFTEAQAAEAMSRVWVYTEDTLIAHAFFLEVVRPLLERHHPDIIWIDPVLAYLGGDVNSQKDVGSFLRNKWNPLLHRHHCAGFGVHHTSKPSREANNLAWKAEDFAYLGSGSAEWANWARAVITLRADGSRPIFELAVPKRGRRLGWTGADGGPCDRKLIAHHLDILCWRAVSEDEFPPKGRPRSYDPSEIAALLSTEGLPTSEWQKLAKDECGVSESTFHRVRRQLKAEGSVFQRERRWMRERALS